MHLDHPITERGQDVVSYHGMVGVDGIASPGIVFVVAFVARQHVEDRVIHPTETERRSQFVSLCRMIEHHVQNHFDAGAVKGPDHFLELQLLLTQTSRVAIGSFGRKERCGIVSPVVPQRLPCLRITARDRSFIELLHGHQFHSGHSQSLEIGNLLHQAAVGSRMIRARLRVNGKAANMRFVNDGLRPATPEGLVSTPLEGLVDKNAFRHRPGIIQLRESQVLLRRQWVVSECRCKIPKGRPRNRGSERIEKKPVEIETMSFGGFVRAVHAVSIELTRADPLHPNVPYVTGAVAP